MVVEQSVVPRLVGFWVLNLAEGILLPPRAIMNGDVDSETFQHTDVLLMVVLNIMSKIKSVVKAVASFFFILFFVKHIHIIKIW